MVTMPPALQCVIAAVCVFNFGLWLFLILAIRQLRAEVVQVFQNEQFILQKENQLMADIVKKADFLAAINAAVADLKTNFAASLAKEKTEILAILQPIVDKGELLNGADLAGVVDAIKSIGSTSLPTLDALSDNVAAALGSTTSTGGGTENPAP